MQEHRDRSRSSTRDRQKAGGVPKRGSLTRRTLVKMMARVACVIAVLTAGSYLHTMRASTHQSLDALQQYINARVAREQWVFDLAVDHLKAIGVELVAHIHDYDDVEPDAELSRRYAVYPDGSMRTRPDRFDPRRDAGMSIMAPSRLDTALKRRVLAAQDTVEQMGRALHIRFQNTWMILPENISFGYWPEEPRWPFETKAGFDFTESSLFKLVSPAKNPRREAVWTDVYQDRVGKAAVVSVAMPVYDGDRFIGVVGHDVLLNELLERTIDVKLEGTYNLLVNKDGNLIAHPMLVDDIARAGGGFHVSKTHDPALESIYRTVLSLEGDAGVLEDPGSQSFLGVVRIRGPEWYFVTVYPKTLLRQRAYQTARVVLLAGLVSLVLEALILFLVLRSQVAFPLRELLSATKKVASGDMDVTLRSERDDELGELAASFTTMARAVRDREAHSRAVEETLRASEERFRLLFESSADALLLFDEDRLVDCNEAASRMLGLMSPDERASHIDDEMFRTEPGADGLKTALAEARREGSHRVEFAAQRQQGEFLFVEALVTAIRFADKPLLLAALRDVTERRAQQEQILNLNEELTDMLLREREKNEMLERLRNTVDILSTPVLEVWREVIALPLVGAIDERRSAMMMEKLLAEVVAKKARYVIIDITGVDIVDTATADRLLQVVAAVELLGSSCVMTGISTQIAQTLVSLGVSFGRLTTQRTLQEGLRVCLVEKRPSAPARRARAQRAK